jgi:hypothetical protein
MGTISQRPRVRGPIGQAVIEEFNYLEPYNHYTIYALSNCGNHFFLSQAASPRVTQVHGLYCRGSA